MNYYSQFKQDEFVNENIFKNKPIGTFVDIGAHDGQTFSNSLFFEELGWSGICIEPNPDIFTILSSNRKCKCVNLAVSDKTGNASFFQINSGPDMLSGLADEYTQNSISRIYDEMKSNPNAFSYIDVQTDTFNNIVDFIDIDFLSIDTEGNELKILQSIDFNKYNIRVISVENNNFDSTFIEFFADKPYNLVTQLGCDEVYVKQV